MPPLNWPCAFVRMRERWYDLGLRVRHNYDDATKQSRSFPETGIHVSPRAVQQAARHPVLSRRRIRGELQIGGHQTG